MGSKDINIFALSIVYLLYKIKLKKLIAQNI